MARMLEGVTIEQLRTLRAVAEAGSFSAAARKLGRVQAAVSQSIDRLEAQLGLRLFDCTGRVPVLTAHGEAVVEAAAKVEDGVGALDELVASLKQGLERTLHIVVDVMFPTESLVAFAKDFAREHPGVGLLLFTEILSGVTAHVREKRSAWGIAIEDADLSDLDSRTIAEVRLIPVAARAHPLALREGRIEAAVWPRRCKSCRGSTAPTASRGATITACSPQDLARGRSGDQAGADRRRARVGAHARAPRSRRAPERAAGRAAARRLGERGAAASAGPGVAARAVMGPVAEWAQRRLPGSARRWWNQGIPSRRVIAVITCPALFRRGGGLHRAA